MGLELSLARLKALAKFAFGMGLTQVYCGKVGCYSRYSVVVLKASKSYGTYFLSFNIIIEVELK